MAFTQADLDTVRGEMTAVRATSIADRSTTYRSMQELIELEQRIVASLGSERSKQFYGVASKGF